MTMLNEYFDGDHFIPAYYADQLATPRSYMLNSHGQPEIHLMQVFPNPANEFVQIQLHLDSKNLTNEKLEIRNIVGELIDQLKIVSTNQFYILDMSAYAAGQYKFILSNEHKLLETATVNVAH